MENIYQLEMDELPIGLTKPATKMGVPFIPFFLNIMGCFFGWMIYQGISGGTHIMSVLVFVLIWGVIYGFMFLITSKDIVGLMICWINFQYFQRLPSRSQWANTDSYQP